MPDETTIEVTPEVADVPDQFITLMKRADGLELFRPHQQRLAEAVEQAAALRIHPDDSPEEQSRKSGLAKRLRIDGFKKTRLAVDALHSTLKAPILKITRELDAAAKTIRDSCKEEEARLEDIEKHAERLEAARLAAIAEARRAELVPLLPPGFILPDLAKMTDEQFANQVAEARNMAAMRERMEAAEADAKRLREEKEAAETEAKRLREEKEAAEAKAAAEQQEKEKREAEAKAAEERKRREEAEAEQNRIRQEAEAKAAEERKRREEAEAEAKRLREEKEAAEAKAAAEQKAREDAARRAAAAPDAEKLRAFVAAVQQVPVPALSDQQLQIVVNGACGEFVRWMTAKANSLIA